MLVAVLTLWLGMSCGIGASVFTLSWLLWRHRTDGLAKPGGPFTCRAAQSTLFALIAAAFWWAVPAAVVLLLLRRWRHQRPTFVPARSYNLAQLLATETRCRME